MPTHNHTIHAARTTDGLAVIGRTLHDLRGIRFAEGEGAVAPPAEQPPAAPTPPAPVPATPPAPAAPPAPTPPPAAPPINYKGDPDEYVRELRAENKTAREAREAAEAAATNAQKERDTLAAERDALAREKHLLRNAPKLGANADLLLDSSSFMKTFADVDLSKEEDVKKAIEDALERNSAFRTGPALPPTSGGGHQGGSPTTPKPTLDSAVKAALTPRS